MGELTVSELFQKPELASCFVCIVMLVGVAISVMSVGHTYLLVYEGYFMHFLQIKLNVICMCTQLVWFGITRESQCSPSLAAPGTHHSLLLPISNSLYPFSQKLDC